MGKDLQGNGLIYLKITTSFVMAYGILYSYYVQRAYNSTGPTITKISIDILSMIFQRTPMPAPWSPWTSA
jgi:hypothetical protein